MALSDEANSDAGDAHGSEVEDDDDEAVYGKPIKYTYANGNKNGKDNKWSNRRAGNSNLNISSKKDLKKVKFHFKLCYYSFMSTYFMVIETALKKNIPL